LGIDTPESKTSNKEEKIRGLLSKKKLQEMLPINEIVKIITIKSDSTDKFGRILGTFITKKKLMSINEWLKIIML
jgi:endonuclease YncB( thermonuclease family)